MEENVFYVEDCIEVVFDYLPEKMREKFGSEEIRMVLYFENEYLEKIGIAGNPPKEGAPLVVDYFEVEQYVIKRAKEEEFEVTLEEVRTIFDGVVEYMKQIGLVTDFGAMDN